MGKPRAFWLSIGWVIGVLVVTGWAMSRGDGDVAMGDALLVGMVLATVLTVVVARFWK